ncbi:MAG: hypothetical protein JWN46_1766 [Acidimicrobiales bacterium]|nr:hypothetical protein [Acidimicrobiales bacterium]
MKRTKFGVGLVAGILMVLFAGSAAHAQYPTTGPTTSGVIPEVTVVAGSNIDVKGDHCPPGSTVTITWDDGTVLATTTAGADGTFSATITVPADAEPGVHIVTATCGSVQQFLKVNVIEPGTPVATGTTLARTGTSNIGPLLGIGAAAVVLGAAFVYGARRPKHSA